jgi:LAS superfamily LD-carboxypeptidase LdcB
MAQKSRMSHLKTILIVFFSLSLVIVLILILRTGYSENLVNRAEEDEIQSFPQGKLANEKEIVVGKNYLMGKFDPSTKEDFVEVESKYTKRFGQYVRKETYEAFVKMHEAASQAGIPLTIVSATRNFDYQRSIWERKWSGQIPVEGKDLVQEIKDPVERAKIILKFSAMPGTSRHHWGTDIDLNALENKYFETKNGEKIYIWLKENASAYGFCQTYTPKNSSRPSGYEEEKWHWSFIPLAKSFLRQYIQKISYDDLKGFKGSETAKALGVIENYVLSINKDCD